MPKDYVLLLKFFLIVLSYLYPSFLYSQDDSLTLNSYMETTNLEVLVPNGYHVKKLDGTLLYWYGRNRTQGGFFFNIYPSDKDIVIGVKREEVFGDDHWDKKQRVLFAKRAEIYHPNSRITADDYRFNNFWKLAIPPAIDSAQGEAIGLGRYFEKKSRADTVVLYPLKIEQGFLYQDKYTKCKVVILHKNDIGRAIIFYFYTDETDPKEVDREIRKSWGFLRFKPEPEIEIDSLKINPENRSP